MIAANLRHKFLRTYKELSPYERRLLLFLLFSSVVLTVLELTGISLLGLSISQFATNQVSSHEASLAPIAAHLGLSIFQLKISAIVAIYLLRVVVFIAHKSLSVKLLSAFHSRIGTKIFGNILRSNYAKFLAKDHSEMTKTVIVETAYMVVVLSSGITVISELIVLTGLLGALVILNPGVTLSIILTTGALAGVVIRRNQEKVKHLGKLRSETQKQLFAVIGQIFNNFKFLKVVQTYSVPLTQFETNVNGYALTSARKNEYANYPKFFLETIGILALVALLALFSGGEAPKPQLIASIVFGAGAFFRLLPSANRILVSLHQISYYAETWSLVTSYLDDSVGEVTAAEPLSFKSEIQLRDVHFSYTGQSKFVLRGFSREIKKGKKILLWGESGRGKTTLMNLLLGLLTPTQGTILIDGTPLGPETSSAWRLNIGYVPQEIFLFNASLRKNVSFGREITEAAFLHALRLCRIEELFVQHGENPLGEQGNVLSGGQRQRVALARALCTNPDVIVMDEPTSSLDPRLAAELIENILAATTEKTLIVVSHNPNFVDRFDEVWEI